MSEHVDMWDQSSSDPDTVSNQVRRYTMQWGLPRLKKDSVETTETEAAKPRPTAADRVNKRNRAKRRYKTP